MLLWFNLSTVQVALATVVSKLTVWFLRFLVSARPRNVTHCPVQEVNEANGKEDISLSLHDPPSNWQGDSL